MTAPSLVIDPGQAGLPGAPPLSDLASIRVQVSSVVPGQDIFVGTGEASAVSAYLDRVPHDSLGDFSWSTNGERPGTFSWTPGETESPAGERTPAAPVGEDFWARREPWAYTYEPRTPGLRSPEQANRHRHWPPATAASAKEST